MPRLTKGMRLKRLRLYENISWQRFKTLPIERAALKRIEEVYPDITDMWGKGTVEMKQLLTPFFKKDPSDVDRVILEVLVIFDRYQVWYECFHLCGKVIPKRQRKIKKKQQLNSTTAPLMRVKKEKLKTLYALFTSKQFNQITKKFYTPSIPVYKHVSWPNSQLTINYPQLKEEIKAATTLELPDVFIQKVAKLGAASLDKNDRTPLKIAGTASTKVPNVFNQFRLQKGFLKFLRTNNLEPAIAALFQALYENPLAFHQLRENTRMNLTGELTSKEQQKQLDLLTNLEAFINKFYETGDRAKINLQEHPEKDQKILVDNFFDKEISKSDSVIKPITYQNIYGQCAKAYHALPGLAYLSYASLPGVTIIGVHQIVELQKIYKVLTYVTARVWKQGKSGQKQLTPSEEELLIKIISPQTLAQVQTNSIDTKDYISQKWALFCLAVFYYAITGQPLELLSEIGPEEDKRYDFFVPLLKCIGTQFSIPVCNIPLPMNYSYYANLEDEVKILRIKTQKRAVITIPHSKPAVLIFGTLFEENNFSGLTFHVLEVLSSLNLTINLLNIDQADTLNFTVTITFQGILMSVFKHKEGMIFEKKMSVLQTISAYAHQTQKYLRFEIKAGMIVHETLTFKNFYKNSKDVVDPFIKPDGTFSKIKNYSALSDLIYNLFLPQKEEETAQPSTQDEFSPEEKLSPQDKDKVKEQKFSKKPNEDEEKPQRDSLFMKILSIGSTKVEYQVQTKDVIRVLSNKPSEPDYASFLAFTLAFNHLPHAFMNLVVSNLFNRVLFKEQIDNPEIEIDRVFQIYNDKMLAKANENLYQSTFFLFEELSLNEIMALLNLGE